MTTHITQQQLESYLWGSATLLRGTIDAGDYKQYIFPLLFYKRLCDVFDEETRAALKESGGDREFAGYRENHRFQIPSDAHWRELRKAATNVGRALQVAMRAIETANPDKLYGIFGDAQWTNKDRLSDAMLRDLIEHFSSLELTIANLPEDELGNGYEYLIKKFADDSGHTAAEFYTNRTVVHLMTELLEPQPSESIYDPTCGSGGMLLSCIAHLRRQGKEWRNVRLFGQERNLMTSSIARMNCFLHGIEDFQIVRGDTLSEPKFVQRDRLMRFDVVLANPPYSVKQWDRDAFASDPWGRNLYGTPPQGRADYAFWQHILCSLAGKNGRCAILFPHGVLFRQEEAEMRRKLIEADVIECIIGLGPNLFYNSPMEACVVICRSSKPKAHKDKILFINAVDEVARERAQSFLTNDHIQRILAAYRAFKDEPGFTNVAGLQEIRAKGGNLSIPLYAPLAIASSSAGEGSSGSDVAAALTGWLKSSAQVRKSVDRICGARSGEGISLPHPNLEWTSLPLFRRKNWTSVRFGDVVQNLNETEQDPAAAGLERFIGLEHVEPGSLHIKTWGSVADGTAFTRRCRPGQVLFGKRRAYQRKLAIAEFDAVVSGDIYVLAPRNDRLLPDFLPFLCLEERFFQHAIETSAGSLSPRTNWTSLASFEFDLPPLDQQRRIAEILRAAEKTCAECEKTVQASNEALNAKLIDSLGNGRIEESRTRFPTKALGEVAFLQTGIAKGKKYSDKVPTVESPYLRVANVQDGHLDLTEVKTIVLPKSDKARYQLQYGDVLICEGGDFDKVGRGTIWRGQIPDCLHQNHVFCLRANRSLVLPEFLALQLASPYGKKYFLSCAKKTSNLASINSTQVRAFPFQLPGLAEQQRVVHEVGELQSARDELALHLNATRKVLRAFTEALA
jgi:type I restriction enzyme M protein